jgi:pyruvate dehydrogenase E2 component (dihydrolipoamide acetyltransferase)
MATKVFMEALSPTMEEGRLLAWMKGEGDEVKEGDVLAEVETDKATMELVARGSGVLRKRIIGEGDTADVGTLIGVIAGADEDISSLVSDAAQTQGPSSGADASSAPSPDAGDDAEERDVASATAALAGSAHTEEHQVERGTPAPSAAAGKTGGPQPSSAAPSGNGAEREGRVKASPLARRLADDAGVTLESVQGSGPGGRIVKRDIEEAARAGGARTEATTTAPAAAAAAPGAEFREVPLSQMRKTIAKRLTQSIGPVPHFFLTVEVDMSESMKIRKKLNERLADDGIKVSPNDLIIKSVAMALRKHPWVNAAWTGEAIRLYEPVHIGVAVAVEEGLITPVVRNAHAKGIGEIAQEVRELAGRARDKKLKPDEYTGSTFSISNLGMFGITEFTAVINPPEAAILAVGGIEEKVVVEDGEMVVRPRMRLTLSCDHRVIDGATGAQFLQTLKGYLEEPMMMMA